MSTGDDRTDMMIQILTVLLAKLGVLYPEVLDRHVDTANERPSFGAGRKRSIVTCLICAIDDVEHCHDDEGIESSEGFKHDGTSGEAGSSQPVIYTCAPMLTHWRIGMSSAGPSTLCDRCRCADAAGVAETKTNPCVTQIASY